MKKKRPPRPAIGAAPAPADPPALLFAQAQRCEAAKDWPAAAAIYRRLLAAQPKHGAAWAALGACELRLEHFDAAGEALRRAVEIDPAQPAAWNDLGVCEFRRHRNEFAENCFRKAIEISPGFVPALNNLGNSHEFREQYELAEAFFTLATTIAPGDVAARLGLVRMLQARSAFAAAETQLGLLLATHPGEPEALARLGFVRIARGAVEEGRAALAAAVAAGASPVLHIHAAIALPPVPADRAGIAAQRARLRAELEALLENPPAGIGEGDLLRYPVSQFYLAYQGDNDRELLELLAHVWLRTMPTLGRIAPHVLRERRPGPVRICFISRFFFAHSVGRFFNPIIARLASLPEFEVSVVSLGFRLSPELSALAQQAQQALMVPASSLVMIRSEVERLEPDIVVYPEIGMDTTTYFLAFARLARLQCVLLGHSETSGVPAIDCFLSSAFFEPEDGQREYTERLIRLPTLPMHLDPPPAANAGLDRAAVGFPADRRVYFCPMKLQKVHPDLDAALAEILRRDPLAEIAFVADNLEPDWQTLLERRFVAGLGVAAAARIRFIPWLKSPADLVAAMRLADAVIDTFHHGGATTTHLCLASGVPMVSWATATARSRGPLGYGRLLGVEDCIADSPQQYVELALRLAQSPAWRAELGQRLEAARARLYQDDAVCAAYVDFFRDAAGRLNAPADLGPAYRPVVSLAAWCALSGASWQPWQSAESAELVEPPGSPRPAGERYVVTTPGAGWAELADCELCGRSTTLLPAEASAAIVQYCERYPSTRMALEDGWLAAHIGRHGLLENLPKAAAAIGRGIAFTAPAADNYYHWLFEQLPRIQALDGLDAYSGWPLLIDEGLHPNLLATLRRLVGERPLIELAPRRRVRVGRLLVIEPPAAIPVNLRPGAAMQPDDVAFPAGSLAYLRTRLAGADLGAPAGRRLYLARAGRYRRLVDAERIERRFVAAGFEVVRTETLDFAAQVRIFSGAGVIAGPAGAAFANLVFAPPGCRVAMLCGDGSVHYAFTNLAQRLGQEIRYVVGEPVENSSAIDYQRDYRVADPAVDETLAWLSGA